MRVKRTLGQLTANKTQPESDTSNSCTAVHQICGSQHHKPKMDREGSLSGTIVLIG